MKFVLAIAAAVALSAGAAEAVSQITSAQIKNRTIRAVDLHPSTVKYLRGQRGPAGPAGSLGPTGPAGGFDPSKISYVQGPTTTIPGSGAATLRAACPAGTKVIGGGYIGATLTAGDVPLASTNEWAAVVGNLSTTATTGYAVAICAAP